MKKINLILIKTDFEYDILDIKLNGDITPRDILTAVYPEPDYNKGLIIYGRLPIWCAQYLFYKYFNRIRKIAQFDPRIGGVVIKSDIPSEELKEIIHLEKFQKYIAHDAARQKTIAFIGPPHSGKSVFMVGLFKRLLDIDRKRFNNEAFIIKGCPDGEGIWSSEINQELVKQLRYKNKFSDDFVNIVIESIRESKKIKNILFVDIGGKIDDYTRKILAECTHAVLISGSSEKAEEWKKEFYGKIKFLAEINSRITGKNEAVLTEIINNETYIMQIDDLTRENNNINIPEEFINYFIRN